VQFPDDDAIILRWEQHWTMDNDGTVHRRDHQWLKLLNSRPIRRVADPRIDFEAGRDELIIHTAQTHLPNGTVLPVPDYSFNIAGPDDVAGWPEYANWQQKIVSFSGIEKDAVIELDYEVVTPASRGAPRLPWIEADLRLNEDYPTVERIVSVTLSEGTALHHQVDRMAPSQFAFSESSSGGLVTYRWAFNDLAGARGEPQSLPWHQRCGRLWLSSCRNTAAWVSAMLDPANKAGRPDDSIREFAESAVEGEADLPERVRKIAKKLHDSFNFVTSEKTLRMLECRTAPEVYRSNYGNALESAALYLAAVRSLGMKASLHVGVNATRWSDSDNMVPTGAAFAGLIVAVDLPGETVFVHPQHGVFANPGNWGRHRLLSADDAGSVRQTYICARGENEPSELHIAGKIVVDDGGHATGDLRIRATGVFFDPAKLETADAQKALVKNLVGRVLSDFDVPGHSVVTLSDDTFRATASVASSGALKAHDRLHVLRFGDGPAFLPDIPIPLARSYRRTDVHLAGRFNESIDVTIELPKEPAADTSIIPGSLPPIAGLWGTVAQTVDVDGKAVRFRRNAAVVTETLGPGDFEQLRQAVNNLRASRSLILGFGVDASAE
jgi:hypothetical protein